MGLLRTLGGCFFSGAVRLPGATEALSEEDVGVDTLKGLLLDIDQ
jgi:hypothetical protein